MSPAMSVVGIIISGFFSFLIAERLYYIYLVAGEIFANPITFFINSLVIFLPIVVLSFGIWLALKATLIPYRRFNRLKREGNYVLADIIEVKEHIHGKNAVFGICAFYEGQIFKDNFLLFNPGQEVLGEKIKVWVDINNHKKYAIDTSELCELCDEVNDGFYEPSVPNQKPPLTVQELANKSPLNKASISNNLCYEAWGGVIQCGVVIAFLIGIISVTIISFVNASLTNADGPSLIELMPVCLLCSSIPALGIFIMCKQTIVPFMRLRKLRKAGNFITATVSEVERTRYNKHTVYNITAKSADRTYTIKRLPCNPTDKIIGREIRVWVDISKPKKYFIEMRDCEVLRTQI